MNLNKKSALNITVFEGLFMNLSCHAGLLTRHNKGIQSNDHKCAIEVDQVNRINIWQIHDTLLPPRTYSLTVELVYLR